MTLFMLLLGSALDRTRHRVVSYEDQVSILREQLSEIFAEEHDWTKAAQLLADIDLDSGLRTMKACISLALLCACMEQMPFLIA